MRTESFIWHSGETAPSATRGAEVDLVLYFGPRERLSDRANYARLREAFPKATLLGCSGGAQIAYDLVEDDTISGIAMSFAATRVRLHREAITSSSQSRDIGRRMGRALEAPNLSAIIILSDGLRVNGSELAEGLADVLPPHVAVAGGMAGDGDRFEETLVGANCSPVRGIVAAAGLYSDRLRVHTGSGGGWTVFGPRRVITKSDRNVLFSLDDQPALGLYETYLGPDAATLPHSGLRFPLLIRDPASPDLQLIRTLLSIDRSNGSMTFAGNLPEGWTAQLMRANFERLADGAGTAAQQARAGGPCEAALLVSCIGRKLVLGQRTEDEIEAVRQHLGGNAPFTGFYSYGEFSSPAGGGPVELHNQTMTLLTLSERAA